MSCADQDSGLRAVADDQMRLRPQLGFNSLAWLIRHMTRAAEAGINIVIAERPQVLDEGDWSR
jgi:hypothetical protein